MKRRKEEKEETVLSRWLQTLEAFLSTCKLWNEELTGLMRSITDAFRASKERLIELFKQFIYSLESAAKNRAVDIDIFLSKGIVDAILDTLQATLDNFVKANCICFFIELCERLNGKMEKKENETKRKETKRKMFERMEEDGYEDCIFEFLHCLVGETNKDISLINNPDFCFVFC
ncbi:uncharacterized protein MONOS_18657 [Monocercomonoides exilis]|uniref:uncharacterized protein n=1 Tax=Monocercomonoides exilis TaxID=2049356 RepID=UPI00355A3535|nr:hypothetical protein MONOS_18657 [Monocercomonoides exilis]